MFTVSELTSRSAMVTWQQPGLRNGIVRRYDVWLELTEPLSTCEVGVIFRCASDKCGVDPVDQARQVYTALHIMYIKTYMHIDLLNASMYLWNWYRCFQVPMNCSRTENGTFRTEDSTLQWNVSALNPFRNYTVYGIVYTVKPSRSTTQTLTTYSDSK